MEVDSDKSKACLDDLRGFVGWMGRDWMVIIGHRYSKITFGANNSNVKKGKGTGVYVCVCVFPKGGFDKMFDWRPLWADDGLS